jgi:ABC-type polysaccharide/polyol phosphate export permease
MHLWPMLGWQDIKQRYRRSVLGPLWLTLSTGAMVSAMGPLYGKLLNQPIGDYFAHLAVGWVVWILIAGIINESCLAFVSAEGFIKQTKLPYTVYIVRLVWRNLIIFLHNLLIVALVLVFYQPSWTWQVLLMPVGVLAIAVNGIWVGLLLGLLCARFRDIPQIVLSVVQVVFFLTPVMWKPDMLGRHVWAVAWNPLYYFVEIVRAPLLGTPMGAGMWLAVLAITVGGFAVTLAIFAPYRVRIAYWV